MSQALKGLVLGASLVVSGAAMAGEPVRLGDAELDGVTAAAATAAGWEVLTFANGNRFRAQGRVQQIGLEGDLATEVVDPDG